MAQATRADRTAAHWRLLGLMPGAPECVIKAAHRAQIELHHPDRGGDAETAKRVNVAYDELRGKGSVANEYVARNYSGEPWVVLGVSSIADEQLVTRAGKLLIGELQALPRLVQKVEWAIANFASAKAAPAQRARILPMTPPPPRHRASAPPPPRAAAPAFPQGLPEKVDFGKVEWGDSASQTIQLTWKHAAPFDVKVTIDGPLRAEVTASKVLPGRFSIVFSIDWESSQFSRVPTTRGYTLDAEINVRWTSRDDATIRAKGVVLYPAVVSASPTSLDLGKVRAQQPVRASLILVSTAPAAVTIEPPAWLQRVDGSGRVLEAPLTLATNVPVRLELRVYWPPIEERAKASFAAGRPVRPTGRIIVRWNDRILEIPVEMVASK